MFLGARARAAEITGTICVSALGRFVGVLLERQETELTEALSTAFDLP